jgi:transcriptional regulator with XRE-family HTH domain
VTRPTTAAVSRRWLAIEVRRLRRERHLSQATVAKALGCQVPKVSLIENGQRPIQDADLKSLLELFEVPTSDHDRYIAELQNSHERGWWEDYDTAIVPGWYRDFMGLEQGATRIRAYQPAIVHGLLQTAEYAAAIYRDHELAGFGEEKIARLVSIRSRRQQILEPKASSPELLVILDEGATRRVVGSPSVMRAQLQQIIAVCEANPRISVRIIPFSRGGAFGAAHGAFTIFGFPFAGDASLVYKERASAADFIDDPRELNDHSVMFRRLLGLALSPDESMATLAEQADQYRRQM